VKTPFTVVGCIVVCSSAAFVYASGLGGGAPGRGDEAAAVQFPADPSADSTQETAIQRLMGLRGAVVVRLDVAPEYDRVTAVDVSLGGRRVTLDLMPTSVRAPGYQLIEQGADGEYREIAPTPVNPLRGEVRGIPGSAAAGGMMPDGLTCRVLLPDGGDYWIEPLAAGAPGAGPGMYVVYTPENLIRGDWRCGVEDGAGAAPDADEGGSGGPAPRGVTLYTAELATDADYEYVFRYGSGPNAAAKIQLVINTMNLQYERDVDVTHVITTQLVRTSPVQPYTATLAGSLLTQFQTQWNTNHTGIVRDAAHLFTGKDLDGGTIGLAFLNAVCSRSGGYGLSQSDFNGNLMSATDVAAHEIGHNWNANHCTCGSPASTMNPSLTSINRFTFSPQTIPEITTFRNSLACLVTAGGGRIPRNDSCENAVRIGEGVFGFSNVGASNSRPESCATIGADVWYRFVAATDGTVNVSTCEDFGDAGFDTVLEAFEGTCNTMRQVACNNDAEGCSVSGTRSRISWSAVSGTTYLIRVGGFAGATGSGVLNVQFVGGSDACGSAMDVTGSGTITDTMFGAVQDGAAGCVVSSRDRWYRFTALTPGVLRVNTCGTHDGIYGPDAGMDTVLSIHSGCPGTAANQLVCNNDWNAGGSPAGACGAADAGAMRDAAVSLTMTAGQTVLIRVGLVGSIFGSYFLSTSFTADNDGCNGAIEVQNGATPFSNSGATTDGPTDCAIGADVWYRYTATCTGGVRIDLCGSSYDTALAVYRTSVCPAVNPVACNNDDGPLCGGVSSSVIFTAAQGERFLIRVGGFSSFQGSGIMTISCPRICACDWNHDQDLTSQDFFNFIAGFFNGNADFDHNGQTTSQDFFDFIACFFAGC